MSDRLAAKKKYVSGLKDYASKGMAAGLKKKYATKNDVPDEDWAEPPVDPDVLTEPPLVPAAPKSKPLDESEFVGGDFVPSTGSLEGDIAQSIQDSKGGRRAQVTLGTPTFSDMPPEEIEAVEAILNDPDGADNEVSITMGKPHGLTRVNTPEQEGIDPNDVEALQAALAALESAEE